MVGNAPWPHIQVKPFVKLTHLSRGGTLTITFFFNDGATASRQAATSGSILGLDNFALIARFGEFIGCSESANTRTEDEDGLTFANILWQL